MGENFIWQAFQGVFRNGVVLFRAKDQANRRVFVRLRPIFASVVEIEVHLAGIGMGELADLQIDDDEAAQFAVKEKEIDAIPFPANAQPALAADKSKIASQIEQEDFQMPQKRFLEIAFRVFVL